MQDFTRGLEATVVFPIDQMPEPSESNEELSTVSGGSAIGPNAKRTSMDYVALAIATCGVGYLPLAPGTWGSLLAVGFYVLVRIGLSRYPTDTTPPVGPYGFLLGQLVVITAILLVGTWAASRTERVLKIKDPGKVVIDEVAGQLLALLPVPLSRIGPGPVLVLIAFILFRFFDIVKPYPARRLESLHGGLGIMADDLVAGTYAAIIVAVVVALRWFA